MRNVYDVDDFNKALDLCAHERTSSSDFHIFRLEANGKKEYGVEAPVHRQHFMDITLIIESGQDYDVFFDHKKQIITNNTLQLLPPFKLISYKIPGEILKKEKGYTLLFTFDFLSIGFGSLNLLNEFNFFRIANEECHIPLSPENAEKFTELFEQMLYQYENNEHRSRQILQGYLWVLLNECKRVYDTNMESSTSKKYKKNSQKILESFQNLVANNIHGRYAVEDYANMLCVSPNHLTQSIKEASGRTPKQFITERRVIEAKSLLQYTNNNITEIAALLNFTEPTHFTKFFKKETGVTPLDFRLQRT